jgi:multisubunit Na+/H+ antiporter MnhF subunit
MKTYEKVSKRLFSISVFATIACLVVIIIGIYTENLTCLETGLWGLFISFISAVIILACGKFSMPEEL